LLSLGQQVKSPVNSLPSSFWISPSFTSLNPSSFPFSHLQLFPQEVEEANAKVGPRFQYVILERHMAY
jgi:hypothetical protein